MLVTQRAVTYTKEETLVEVATVGDDKEPKTSAAEETGAETGGENTVTGLAVDVGAIIIRHHGEVTLGIAGEVSI